MFEKEIKAFERQTEKFDLAFKRGAFGLNDALEIAQDVNTLLLFFREGESGLINRIADSAHIEEPVILNQSFIIESPESSVPGTNDKIAQPVA